MIHRGKRREFAMAAAVLVRGDYDAAQMRELAKRSEDAAQTRRLLALAAIYDGGSRSEAAKIGGVGLQTAVTQEAEQNSAAIVRVRIRLSQPG